MRWFSPDRGFGFVRAEGFGEDIFLHRDELVDGSDPEAHQEVDFTLEGDDDGLFARNAVLLSAPTTPQRHLGRVVGARRDKSYAFVQLLDDDEADEAVELFLARPDVHGLRGRRLRNGMTLTFRVVDTPRGPQAVDARLADGRGPDT